MKKKEKNNKKLVLYISFTKNNDYDLEKNLHPFHFKIINENVPDKIFEILSKEKVSIILIDIYANDINGYKIATKIKRDEKFCNIPIVAFTTCCLSQKLKGKMIVAGFSGIISKPIIDIKHLVESINEYIAGKKIIIDKNSETKSLIEYNFSLIEHSYDIAYQLERANEGLLELEKIKKDIIGIVSHELRTPLSTVIGYLEFILLKKSNFNIDQKLEKYINIIHNEVLRLSKTIDNTLSIVNIEKQFKIKYNIDILKMIESIHNSFSIILEQRNLKFSIFSNGTLPLIVGDEDKLYLAIYHIVSNSIKFTGNGGVIDVSIIYPFSNVVDKYGFDGNDYFAIWVEDTGIGIPKDKLKEIFKPFVELGDLEHHHSSDFEFMGKGSGLGLSIAMGIIEKHNGFIWAENRDIGSRFIIVLPINYSESGK